MVGEHMWEHLTPQDMGEFARRWLEGDPQAAESCVLMGFTAPAALQWAFVVAAFELASSDEHLALIAAGPLECLLSRKGEEAIDWVERQARTDPEFRRMLTGVWQNVIPDDLWRRVRSLQSMADDPLADGDGPSASSG